MDERKVKFQIDTGASCNVINLANMSPRMTLEPTNKVLSLYDQSKVRPLGVCQSRIRNNVTGISCEAEFVVIESSKATPILGCRNKPNTGSGLHPIPRHCSHDHTCDFTKAGGQGTGAQGVWRCLQWRAGNLFRPSTSTCAGISHPRLKHP